jgi:hypothetical protein
MVASSLEARDPKTPKADKKWLATSTVVGLVSINYTQSIKGVVELGNHIELQFPQLIQGLPHLL